MKENSIEEDMKILEKLINTMKSDRELFDEKIDKEIYAFFINALEHILQDYKRVLKENEELLEVKVSASAHNRILELEKENEELKNDYENLNNSVVVKNHCIKNSIPVQKVEDKIEELQKTNFNDYTKKQDGNNVKMEILYEFKKMLESEEK